MLAARIFDLGWFLDRPVLVTSIGAAVNKPSTLPELCSLNPPVSFQHTLTTLGSSAPEPSLFTLLLSPEGDVAAKERIVGADAFAKDRALTASEIVPAPINHPNAIALLLGAAFQARLCE